MRNSLLGIHNLILTESAMPQKSQHIWSLELHPVSRTVGPTVGPGLEVYHAYDGRGRQSLVSDYHLFAKNGSVLEAET